ncbi:mandelate racemase/muconate lactonizing enzyme family protein [Bradyrhizobium sp. BWA-3-5]|uniref:mandelate racemase/muconate lactonizing enzyme family protein n=1 Tax=Bradyrhizobium sp. BWA-3-5 TaxID=3080013 RepID=UPI00293EEC2D|nr:mandelate racemase/muconate lactonizing enzyme family protein [Bradyrhizobium sp. BWA-3-5]WOH63953.1 mandelate racemase/muconate lactonizing enzyme family protein [Bradyrhizobium sp. BWA-3-5]
MEVVAEDGTVGFGEALTHDGFYIEGFPGSVRAAVRALAPVVLAHDVFDPAGLNEAMDVAILGHLPAKAAIDAALWDLRGKILGQSTAALLGGFRQDTVPAVRQVIGASSEEMAAIAVDGVESGFTHFQVKVGEDPIASAKKVHAVYDAIHERAQFITCDANRKWTLAQARLFLNEIAKLNVYFEQPCDRLTQLAELRRISPIPMLVDESIRGLADLVDCLRLEAADSICIKPARVGGLTKAAQLRDLAQAAGLMVMLGEPGGGEIAYAGLQQLAATCNPSSLICASSASTWHKFYPSMKSLAVTEGGKLERGRINISRAPGLGIEVDRAALGDPLFIVPN